VGEIPLSLPIEEEEKATRGETIISNLAERERGKGGRGRLCSAPRGRGGGKKRKNNRQEEKPFRGGGKKNAPGAPKKGISSSYPMPQGKGEERNAGFRQSGGRKKPWPGEGEKVLLFDQSEERG